MRYFRRLPPLLRVVSLLSLLFPLVFLVLPLNFFVDMLRTSRTAALSADRLVGIVLNLCLVGMASFLVVRSYTERVREPGAPAPFPLDSWQSQVRAFVLVAALPICALVFMVVIPPTSRAFVDIVPPVSLLGVCVLAVAGFNASRRWHDGLL